MRNKIFKIFLPPLFSQAQFHSWLFSVQHRDRSWSLLPEALSPLRPYLRSAIVPPARDIKFRPPLAMARPLSELLLQFWSAQIFLGSLVHAVLQLLKTAKHSERQALLYPLFLKSGIQMSRVLGKALTNCITAKLSILWWGTNPFPIFILRIRPSLLPVPSYKLFLLLFFPASLPPVLSYPESPAGFCSSIRLIPMSNASLKPVRNSSNKKVWEQ